MRTEDSSALEEAHRAMLLRMFDELTLGGLAFARIRIFRQDKNQDKNINALPAFSKQNRGMARDRQQQVVDPDGAGPAILRFEEIGRTG